MKWCRVLLLVAAVSVITLLGTGSPASAGDQDVVMTGGKTGDYYLYFGPPIVKLLEKAWVDAPLRESQGTPDNMDWLVDHPLSYALLQGNVYADLSKTDKYAGKIKILRGSGIGNETVLAVMNDRIYSRSQGSWAAVAAHAKQVRIVTASEASGPGQTLHQLMQLDPNGLGKAEPKFLSSMDAAINAVADGQADVALMVQFANPQNPRFKLIAEKGLKIVPVLSASMKTLEIPGVGPGIHPVRECAGDAGYQDQHGLHANPGRDRRHQRQRRPHAYFRLRNRSRLHASRTGFRQALEVDAVQGRRRLGCRREQGIRTGREGKSLGRDKGQGLSAPGPR